MSSKQAPYEKSKQEETVQSSASQDDLGAWWFRAIAGKGSLSFRGSILFAHVASRVETGGRFG